MYKNQLIKIIKHIKLFFDDKKNELILKAKDTKIKDRGLEPKITNLNKKPPKLIAFYLPQFHPIPENDQWWGKGFTEWTNVTKARPLFKGHYQPRLPTELGFYDLRVPETREEQAALARAYGIHGFCYYYYWFNARRLLERPLNEVLSSGKPDFPFCICWANENWTRRWDGQAKEVLMAQKHSPESDVKFIQDVIPLFKDPRYIRVNNRPLLLVYRVDLLPEARETAERWRQECQKEGIGEILLGACRSFGITDPHPYGFDVAVDFPPHKLFNNPSIQNQLKDLEPNFTGQVFDYESCIQRSLAEPPTIYPRYPTAMLAWDNTARRGCSGQVFHRATPAIYQKWLSQLIAESESLAYPYEPLVFINAWNEWAEGTYLEPDRLNGRAYLEATVSALNAFQPTITLYKQTYAFLFNEPSQRLAVEGKPEISIIIPVFNKVDLTLECLRSLHYHSSRWSYEIIVVDDGSTDETELLISAISEIRYIKCPENQGFVGACNLGAEKALGDYLVFLNNDATVCEGWLDALRETFDNWSRVGLVGSKLIFPNGTMQECGSLIFEDGSAANYGRGKDPDHPSYCFARETDYVSGAAIMLRRDLFWDLGGFEQVYAPAYYEDTDLALKVRHLKGLRVIVNPLAKVIHHEGGTSGTDLQVGPKKYQVINQKTFYERWREVLRNYPQRNYEAPARNPYCSKKILVIDFCIPRPDVDSGSVRMAAILRILRNLDCQVTFAATNLAYDAEYAKPLEAMGIEILRYSHCQSLPKYLKQARDSFDYVILSKRDPAKKHIKAVKTYCPKAKTIFDTVDLHFLRESRAQELRNIKNWLKIFQNNLESQREIELDLIRQTDVTVVVSPVEKEMLAKITPGKKVQIISNIHQIAPTQSSFAERSGILFIGYFAHAPNVDAVLWFAKEILPLLAQNGEQPVLHLIGSNPTPEISSLASDLIKVHGFVKDPLSFFEQCRISIAPVRFGAGVKGKINQSLALGLPCVTTSIGAEGMYLVDGVNALIADEPLSFAQKIRQLYENETLWYQVREEGFKNIKEHFSPEAAKTVLENMLSLVN